MAKARRSKVEHEWRRARIVEAATAVFARCGIHGATMEEIAREADYSSASLYNYFKNRDALAKAVLVAIGERFVAAIRAPDEDAAPFEVRMRGVLRRSNRLAEESRSLFVAFFAGRAIYEPSLRAELRDEGDRIYQAHVSALAELMAVGLAEGTLRKDASAEEHALVWMALGHAFFFRWLSRCPEIGECPPLDEQADWMLDMFLNGSGKR